MNDVAQIHATSVAIGSRAVLLLGPSGIGKSDLALRLIDRGATLISDDITLLTLNGDTLLAGPPATIAGRIEVRGIGIIDMPHIADVPVALAVDLDRPVERMPEVQTIAFQGISVALMAVAAHEPSTPIKVERMLERVMSAS